MDATQSSTLSFQNCFGGETELRRALYSGRRKWFPPKNLFLHPRGATDKSRTPPFTSARHVAFRSVRRIILIRREMSGNTFLRVIRSVSIHPTDRLDPSRNVRKHIIQCHPIRLDPSDGSSRSVAQCEETHYSVSSDPSDGSS